MITLEIGKPVPIRYGNMEGIRLDYSPESFTIIMRFSDITPLEIKGFKEALFELRFLACDAAMLFLFRLSQGEAGFPWADAPFQWCLVRPENRVPPEPDSQRPFVACLVEHKTGNLVAWRVLRIAAETHQALNHAILRQVERQPPATKAEGDAWLDALHTKRPPELAALAAGRIELMHGREAFAHIALASSHSRKRGK